MSLETLLPQLEDPEHPVAAASLAGLSNLPPDEQSRFLGIFAALSVQRRRDIIDRLAGLAEDNVELDFSNVFIAALADDDVQVRADSIKALWEYEGNDLPARLIELIRDAEALVRAEAALALGRLLLRAELQGQDDSATHEIADTLRAIVRDERELVEVRGRAVEALGARSEPWIHDMIEGAYDSGDRRLRISAVHAMGRNADPGWLPTIIDEMSSEDPELRFEAATAAGTLADETAVPHLLPVVDDDDAEVQEAAIEALGLIGGETARAALQAIASETADERILDAVVDALAIADFTDDPLGVRTRFADPVDPNDDEDFDE